MRQSCRLHIAQCRSRMYKQPLVWIFGGSKQHGTAGREPLPLVCFSKQQNDHTSLEPTYQPVA